MIHSTKYSVVCTGNEVLTYEIMQLCCYRHFILEFSIFKHRFSIANIIIDLSLTLMRD